ncbi:uncharacterized protein [Gossypium hirsutum]|uniref:RNase H type-1 domain-containing protein n=1 Tax=Gossypium hirsutum TaxID=3635 RepID=A0A1U8L1Q2_GOSHI|nr:uncharacterized protein LOC107921644 [Gossypium hirsutum]
MVLGLIEEFDDITFNYLPRDENQMANALATLASMINVSKQEDAKPIQMSICEAPSYCYNMEEEERDDHPWYQDILRYVRNREYPNQATENDKSTLRRLACDYVLHGEILNKRRKDQFSFALHAYRTSTRTFTGAMLFSLVYGMEAVLSIKVEIPSL